MKKLSGWGRFPKIKTSEITPSSESELISALKSNKSLAVRGNGRSYGDLSINTNITLTMTKFNRIIEWDEVSGNLIAESGVLIADIIEDFLPKGWFPFVTAGTKFITLGGAIACDIHGKNHHVDGSFGNYVNWIDLIDQNNELIRCSQTENPKLFHWTIGGLGLTGVILRCSIKLKKIETGWINQNTVVNKNLMETLKSFDKYYNATYSVAWIDCISRGKSFGRSILMLGEHANLNDAKHKPVIFPVKNKQRISLFFDVPSFVLNKLTISIFNKFYFLINQRKGKSLIGWDNYFFPLDSIGSWNKMYGKNGFFQFQCVLPIEHAQKGAEEILKTVQENGSNPFLAVLKKFGKGNGHFSFPREGFTISLDFKVTKRNLRLSKRLHKIVEKFSGYIYFAKDSTLDRDEFFQQKNDEMIKLRVRNLKIESELSKRLTLQNSIL